MTTRRKRQKPMRQHDRTKVDLRLGPSTVKAVEDLAVALGVTKNSLMVLGVCLLAGRLTPVLGAPVVDRAAVMRALGEEWHQMMARMW